MELRMNLILV
uniref:Uncharacterized protein n=1 Tax=Anguilla anguilla TaxID=7936 RepID=A0A0E9SQ72_ANGAN